MGIRSPARAHHTGVCRVRWMRSGRPAHGTRPGQRRDVVGSITRRRRQRLDLPPLTVRSTSSVPRPELAPHRWSCILLAVAGHPGPLLHSLERTSNRAVTKLSGLKRGAQLFVRCPCIKAQVLLGPAFHASFSYRCGPGARFSGARSAYRPASALPRPSGTTPCARRPQGGPS
jgi:hypothetical protein